MSPLELAPGALVIGDLHLDPQDARDAARLVDWLEGREPPALVIVGDLFDAWVGPAHESAPGARAVIEALARLTARGSALHVLHGNRDFLLGSSFAAATGARLYPEGFEARLDDGTRLALVHGDELCTLDHPYQRLRRVTRSRLVQRLGPHVPPGLARVVARRLRSASVQAVAHKPSAQKAMQAGACRALARARGAAVVVCGHAHRARDEQLSDGPRWVVLDAFGGARDLLELGARGGLRLAASGARLPAEESPFADCRSSSAC